MSDSEKPVSSGPETSGVKPGPGGANRRRGRRGGRGRRKSFAPRRDEPKPVASETHHAPPPAPGEPVEATEAVERTETPRESTAEPQVIPPRRAPEPRPLLERVQRLTERVARVEPEHRGSAISQAIDEVMEIVDALKRAVDQMEEVLELVELAERQKLADEREIESLRRALRQLHERPREQRGNRDSREQRESRGPQEPREQRGPRDFRPPRETQEPSDRPPESDAPPQEG